MAMTTNVKEWYTKTYQTDELGSEIKPDIDFWGVFHTLDRYKDVYEFIGVEDSIVRERVFAKLAELMKVDYKYVYSMWLKA